MLDVTALPEELTLTTAIPAASRPPSPSLVSFSLEPSPLSPLYSRLPSPSLLYWYHTCADSLELFLRSQFYSTFTPSNFVPKNEALLLKGL